MNLRSRLRSSFACFAILAAVAFAPAVARADRDAVQFATNIVIGPEESVHDAVCFFCSVDAKGAIDHDVVVFFGNVHIAKHSDHDVVTFFGNIRLDPDASIEHDVVDFFGNVHLGENATIGNDTVAMFGSVTTADSASIHGNRVTQPAWLALIPLMIFGGIIYGIMQGVRSYRRRQHYAAGYYPPPPPPPVRPQF